MSTAYDAIIIGGGPAGSTCALLLARAGLRVCILEKTTHPRFHIGESMLPRLFPLIQELGLESQLRNLPHVPKYGAEFGFGDDPRTMKFRFADGLNSNPLAFNVERSGFDQMLLAAARAAGAEVFEGAAALRIDRLEERGVELVATGDRRLAARMLLDCSGHGTVVGRHLGTRKLLDESQLRNAAYFQHFDDVERLPGDATGHPTVLMCDEGWFWLIGLSETKTSVGFVCPPSLVKQIGVPPDQMLQWAVSRCPVAQHRMRNAVGPTTNQVLSDFSYTCRPHAGPGYFLVGDAGCFLDPIFSTGVTLAMMSAREAAAATRAILQQQIAPVAARARYCTFVDGSTRVFWGLIRNFYRHSFRELFMEGQGPLQVHRAVISVLAGQVFPKPSLSLRWRLHFFHVCVFLQRFFSLVPRRKRFSLLQQIPFTGAVSEPLVESHAGAD